MSTSRILPGNRGPERHGERSPIFGVDGFKDLGATIKDEGFGLVCTTWGNPADRDHDGIGSRARNLSDFKGT